MVAGVIFHFITDKEMCIINIPFGTELPKLRVEELRPKYVTITGKELTEAALTEAQMVSYLRMIRNKLDFGGQVFLEVVNYE